MAMAIPLVIMAASAAMKAVGTVREGQAQAAAATYNAKLADNQAAGERAAAGARTEQVYRQAYATIGRQAADVGASGIAGSEGTPLALFAQSARNAERDALNTMYEGENRARSLEASAELERARGRQAKRGAYMKAATDLMGTAGSMAAGGSFGGSGTNAQGYTKSGPYAGI